MLIQSILIIIDWISHVRFNISINTNNIVQYFSKRIKRLFQRHSLEGRSGQITVYFGFSIKE